jgi:hypothetical protein
VQPVRWLPEQADFLVPGCSPQNADWRCNRVQPLMGVPAVLHSRNEVQELRSSIGQPAPTCKPCWVARVAHLGDVGL